MLKKSIIKQDMHSSFRIQVKITTQHYSRKITRLGLSFQYFRTSIKIIWLRNCIIFSAADYNFEQEQCETPALLQQCNPFGRQSFQYTETSIKNNLVQKYDIFSQFRKTISRSCPERSFHVKDKLEGGDKGEPFVRRRRW